MLREIDTGEMDLVSGGNIDDDIIVNGQRPSGSTIDDGAWVYQMERANFESEMRRAIQHVDGYSVTVQIGEPIPYNPDEWVDTNDDGVKDTPEIVVTSNASTSEIRAANELTSFELYQWGILGAGLSVFLAEWVAALSVTERAAYAAAVAAGVPPGTAAWNAFLDASFRSNLDKVQNPENHGYDNMFL
ncbi:MAG: hypothetical protein SFV20_01895 [Sphingopyxis sp.]|nr:hypothetical protein [Sphingopyxis sp.]